MWKSNGHTIQIEKVYQLTIDGIPYENLPDEKTLEELNNLKNEEETVDSIRSPTTNSIINLHESTKPGTIIFAKISLHKFKVIFFPYLHSCWYIEIEIVPITEAIPIAKLISDTPRRVEGQPYSNIQNMEGSIQSINKMIDERSIQVSLLSILALFFRFIYFFVYV